MTVKFKKLWNQFLGLFPTALPTGIAAFNVWADSFLETYDMPTTDIDSIRFALASIIMHLGSTAAYKSKFYFFLTIKSGAAKQVAGQAFFDIKTKQKEAAAKEALAEASNEPKV